MQWTIVGLGNPDSEYKHTRHNVGREVVDALRNDVPSTLRVLDIDGYMNNSGGPIKKVITSKKAAAHLIVVHDDLDIPLGRIKISFGSGAAGHNGVLSIEKALGTKEYVRIRIGISGSTPSGKLKRPKPEKLADYVLAKFRSSEADALKKMKKAVKEAVQLLCTEGLSHAMNKINSR